MGWTSLFASSARISMQAEALPLEDRAKEAVAAFLAAELRRALHEEALKPVDHRAVPVVLIANAAAKFECLIRASLLWQPDRMVLRADTDVRGEWEQLPPEFKTVRPGTRGHRQRATEADKRRDVEAHERHRRWAVSCGLCAATFDAHLHAARSLPKNSRGSRGIPSPMRVKNCSRVTHAVLRCRCDGVAAAAAETGKILGGANVAGMWSELLTATVTALQTEARSRFLPDGHSTATGTTLHLSLLKRLLEDRVKEAAAGLIDGHLAVGQYRREKEWSQEWTSHPLLQEPPPPTYFVLDDVVWEHHGVEDTHALLLDRRSLKFLWWELAWRAACVEVARRYRRCRPEYIGNGVLIMVDLYRLIFAGQHDCADLGNRKKMFEELWCQLAFEKWDTPEPFGSRPFQRRGRDEDYRETPACRALMWKHLVSTRERYEPANCYGYGPWEASRPTCVRLADAAVASATPAEV